MLKVRVIPVLLLRDGLLVRSEGFDFHQIIGNPVQEVARYSEWSVDEIIYLDISRDAQFDARRNDHKTASFGDFAEVLDALSSLCFVPLTFGGGINTFDDAAFRIAHGADKVAINSAGHRRPALLTEVADVFGSQAVVASIDARRHADGSLEVFVDGGRTATGLHPVFCAMRAEDCGAGEILIGSIDRDGTGQGYDLDLVEQVAAAVNIPVIALGGVGTFEHFAPAVRAGASAVAAANLFHFKELSDRQAKRSLARAGVNVRT
ncbi:MAG: imidazole glycerol phosphate synthase subunit HisF [Acidimicrobiia bacterium]